ncbi:MAG TPA: peptide deformylase [Candidatus Pacearchaeota archaeon]|nr:peptide deformylase [Candidatus Paceibacterota bacterium]HOK00448.1 peptide deformylase [Candidatus Pacearchaeota archaeon]HOL90369.1 peptide deformylase [Candidatus Pacearchaeota archaeon]HPO68361.1 peptide deformylase [Candidatus Pacearchaeota archaeon]
MALLEIKKYPDPILKKKSYEVEKITDEIKKLIEDMAETMKKNNGVGIAAPQVGVLKRIIVIETENGIVPFINPKIIKKSKEKETMEEGCLSFPGVFLKIKRPKEVEIEALNKEGKKIKAKGLLARILQHEIDHLDGILLIDRLSFLGKIKFKIKYEFNRRFNKRKLA